MTGTAFHFRAPAALLPGEDVAGAPAVSQRPVLLTSTHTFALWDFPKDAEQI